MENEPRPEKQLKGIPREELQGRPQDPTGVDIYDADGQQMPAGGEGLEGGAGGKFTRGFREEREPARRFGGRSRSEPIDENPEENT